ncbi:MAG: hypothetical protein GY760_25150 [Deltaproteobacteria bacterium]|nr:hypothetical protein [Deltaproteobacteria bacterium]
MKRITTKLAFLSLFILFLSSCASAPDKIDYELSEEAFFKSAQKAMDLNQYRLAIYYYEVYLVRYPENHQKTIAAEYERAFIFYKTKDYEYSKVLFNQILDKFENSPFTVLYPERYKTLSETLIGIIDEKTKGKKKKV